MTRVVDAWDEGYRAGVHDATHPASSPTINPYQRSDVDADHVIAEAARAWWRAGQRFRCHRRRYGRPAVGSGPRRRGCLVVSAARSGCGEQR